MILELNVSEVSVLKTVLYSQFMQSKRLLENPGNDIDPDTLSYLKFKKEHVESILDRLD